MLLYITKYLNRAKIRLIVLKIYIIIQAKNLKKGQAVSETIEV